MQQAMPFSEHQCLNLLYLEHLQLVFVTRIRSLDLTKNSLLLTPGISDTTIENKEIQREICRCVGITSPGPHAFILVLNATVRFTNEEQRSVDYFVKYLYPTQRVAEGIMFLTRPSVSQSVSPVFLVSATPLKPHIHGEF